jgi:TolA-binding protein
VRAAKASRPSPSKPSPSTLAAEASLLAEARSALARGDAARALALLVDHTTAFPAGTLTVDARALRVRSLCALGRTVDAERTAAALVDEFPESPSAIGVRDACGAQPRR